MPQVDLETLVSACAGGNSHDRKIACEESLPDSEIPPPENENREVSEIPPDFPPESFWLSKDAEFDWLDQNAFFERKDSTKGSSNSTNLSINPTANPVTNSNSQRFSLNFKSKASILGLPKLHKTCFVDKKKNRRNSGNTRLFPKQSGSNAKPDASLIEPSSPKVSCMGRVRSKRDRSRRWKNRRRESKTPPENEKPNLEHAKNSFFARFRAFFSGWRKKPADAIEDTSAAAAVKITTTKARDAITVHIDALSSTESHPRKSLEMESPGLGGMKRFASGRRSGSWVVGVGESE